MRFLYVQQLLLFIVCQLYNPHALVAALPVDSTMPPTEGAALSSSPMLMPTPLPATGTSATLSPSNTPPPPFTTRAPGFSMPGDKASLSVSTAIIVKISLGVGAAVLLAIGFIIIRARGRLFDFTSRAANAANANSNGNHNARTRPKPKKIHLTETQFELLEMEVVHGPNKQADAESTNESIKDRNNADDNKDADTQQAKDAGDGQGDGGITSCAVCLDDIVDGQNITHLPCKHVFHTQCIREWLVSKSAECPLCKRSVLKGLGLPDKRPSEEQQQPQPPHQQPQPQQQQQQQQQPATSS